MVYNSLMIYFIWSSPYPLLFGRGGSETYTIGHVRELMRRGIPCKIITTKLGEDDGRKTFPDIPFEHVDEADLKELDGTLIFISLPLDVRTKNPSYVIFHVPPVPVEEGHDRAFYAVAARDKRLIATSKAASHLWSTYLARPVSIVYPFAAPEFGQVKRRAIKKPTIIFAGRLLPHKGIYVLLSAMHAIKDDFDFIATTASAFTKDGEIIEKLLQAHPRIKVVRALSSPLAMAKLLAKCTMLVMPTSAQLFTETFGMLSIEAQHAGCRVVASDQGGLPETNIGGLTLIPPDDPVALAREITSTAKLGPLTEVERAEAIKHFTLKQSVDSLLEAIDY